MNPPDTLVGTLWKRHNRVYVVIEDLEGWCRLVSFDGVMRDHIYKTVLPRWYYRITGEKK
jgi:hypothetical protein